jgi:adenylate cyclase class IV
MARNIELKAYARHYEALRERAATLSDQAPLSYRQLDSFYSVPQGRLKLRRFDDGAPAELIHYQRDDTQGPRVSFYMRSPVTDADATHTLLSAALGTRGNVSKERLVYLVGRTRIHLDRVDGLGDFIEIEVVLDEEEEESDGEREAHRWLAELGVPAEDHVPNAYIDLLKGA